MADGVKESLKVEIFRKMEETSHRLMEEYKFVDAATPTASRGYTRSGDCAYRVVLTGQPIPDATFVSAVYTTQPQGCDPKAGTAECIFCSSAAEREFLACSGYPTPILHATDATQACPYHIVRIPSKGLGMIAVRDLVLGEVIISERPLVVAPQ